MKFKLLIAAALVSMVTMFYGCQDMPQQVLVAKQDLKPNTVLIGSEPEAVPINVDTAPPKIKEALQKAFPDQPVVYLTTIEHVAPKVPVDDPATPNVDESQLPAKSPIIIPITPPSDANGKIDFGTWISQAAPAIASTLPVGAAPWLPLAAYVIGLFGNKRSRGHLADTASALNPLDGGSVDLGEAKSSFAKAIGWSHSLQTPEELRAMADKLEAEQKADAKLATVAK